jgi:H+-transporting ATPase
MGQITSETGAPTLEAAAEEAWAPSHPESGLSDQEASSRLAIHGYNEIPTKKRNPLLDFLGRFWGPMPWLLETAMLLSSFLGHVLEATIIATLLAVNAVIGQLHAKDSARAIELLRQKLAAFVRVLRDGVWVSRPAREAVPGDVIAVRLGEVVPADGLIIDGDLALDQSALTGESLPVEAGKGSPVYSGSPVTRGEARCLVTATGPETYLGKTAKLVEAARPKSHQEEVMLHIVRIMMYLGLAASLLVAAYALALRIDPVVILTFIVIFLMGAVPVALPAVLTIVQSVGALQLSRKGAVVARLEAIEDAASIDTLCFDKTGTITQNRLAVAELAALPGTGDSDLLRLALLASATEGKDLLDAALMEKAKAMGVDGGGYGRKAFLPFDPSIKRTEAVVEKDGVRSRVVKGAPGTVMELCLAGPVEEALMLGAVDRFSRKGYRSIAVAAGPEDGGLIHQGLIAFSDPPRADSREMIGAIQALGIRPMMLTGDDGAIAAQVASAVGIGDRVLRAADIEGLEEAERLKRVAGADVVAGIFPEDKFLIVRAFQAGGHMVGMTGDGVNDAPALRQAEVGIAVQGASDVAKAAAGIVLTEPGLAVIVHAIETSRQIYQRMLSWVINKITKVISFVGLLAVGFLWLKQLPMSLLGMSLLVFSNDFATMSFATDNVTRTPKPNRWEVGNITLASAIPGLLYLLQGLGGIAIGLRIFHLAMPELGTLVLLNQVFSSQFRALSVRERGHFWESRPGSALIRTSIAVILAFCALGIFGGLMPALPASQVLLILGYSALCGIATDFPKVLAFRRFGL